MTPDTKNPQTDGDRKRAMILDSNPRGRILQFLNSLALKRVKAARTVKCCALCACPIEAGQEFRDGGIGRRAHEFCFRAVRRDKRFQ